MSRANIYIRKENEDRWEGVTDKSAWVNAMLEKSPPNSKVMAENLEPAWQITNENPAIGHTGAVASVSLGNVLETAENSVGDKNFELCKHDQVKGLCKLGCK